MKKEMNKKVLIISAVVVIMVAIAGILYITNKPQANAPTTGSVNSKPEVSTLITASVRKASFGSVINVTLSVAGKKEYKDAVKYQVYYDKKPITSKEVIGKPTTAFPVRKENDKVEIKFTKADGKEVASVELKLQKGAPVK